MARQSVAEHPVVPGPSPIVTCVCAPSMPMALLLLHCALRPCVHTVPVPPPQKMWLPSHGHTTHSPPVAVHRATLTHTSHVSRVGQNHTYIRMCGVHTRFWPTLYMCHMSRPTENTLHGHTTPCAWSCTRPVCAIVVDDSSRPAHARVRGYGGGHSSCF
jgi:hypothetical protein